jgi:hypothetical protein
VPTKDKNAAIGDVLLGGDWATPTRTQNVDEPTTSRPPSAPEDVVARQPKIDPFELAKDKRYKVDLSELLKIDILYAAFDKTFSLDLLETVCWSPMTGTSWNV